MRKYTCAFGEEVDLDNPETYKHLPDDLTKLDNLILKEIGYAICYMDYWHPSIFGKEKVKPEYSREWTNEQIEIGYPDALSNSGFYQRQRVYKLINNFTENRHNNYQNILWYKEQIFLFQDETENMC